MGYKELKSSGAFVLTLLVLTIVGVPFGIEQIGSATGLFSFPVTATIKGWFTRSAPAAVSAAKPVDWEVYRRDLEGFTEWAEGRRAAAIVTTNQYVYIPPTPIEKKPRLEIWHIPVTSCTAGRPSRSGQEGRKGYVYISGFDRCFTEGDRIEPSATRCGYEVAFVGDRTAWFRAILDSTNDASIGDVKLPEFTRVGDGSIVIGTHPYDLSAAFPLESGGWLTIDAFLPPDGVLFKLRDARREEIASILCVVISEKGEVR